MIRELLEIFSKIRQLMGNYYIVTFESDFQERGFTIRFQHIHDGKVYSWEHVYSIVDAQNRLAGNSDLFILKICDQATHAIEGDVLQDEITKAKSKKV